MTICNIETLPHWQTAESTFIVGVGEGWEETDIVSKQSVANAPYHPIQKVGWG